MRRKRQRAEFWAGYRSSMREFREAHPDYVACEPCNQSGFEYADGERRSCRLCNGHGRVPPAPPRPSDEFDAPKAMLDIATYFHGSS